MLALSICVLLACHPSKFSPPLLSYHENEIDRMTPLLQCQACYSRSTRTQAVPRSQHAPIFAASKNAISASARNHRLMLAAVDGVRGARCSGFGPGKHILSCRELCVRFLSNLLFTPFPPRTKLNPLPQLTNPGRRSLLRAPISVTSKRHQRSGAHPQR